MSITGLNGNVIDNVGKELKLRTNDFNFLKTRNKKSLSLFNITDKTKDVKDNLNNLKMSNFYEIKNNDCYLMYYGLTRGCV